MNENELLCFADIRAEEVEWLWYPYIPYGKLTILQGDPGSGKTMLALSLAALLSNGQCLPFAQQAGEPVNILYQTSEDGLADTIKPRLVSAQADCSRILSIDENTAALTFGDPRLEETVRQKNIRLIILDPLSAYIGATVSLNQANEVRSAFRSLYTMAQRTGCAVLIVAHMNKMKGLDALYRTSGSIDIAGAVRSILTVAKYKNSPTLRVMVPVKSNLAPAGSALLFELTDHVEWREQIEADADLLLAGLDREAVPTKQDRVAEELTRLLQGGPMPQKEIVSFFEQRNISRRTVELTKSDLGIVSFRQANSWYWKLPETLQS